MTASRVGHGLYVGSFPDPGLDFSTIGVHSLVFCAMELQPSPLHYPNVHILRCPIDDADPIRPGDFDIVREASMKVAKLLKRKRKVICTCRMGLNRSAFVAAMALMRLGVNPQKAIDDIRKARGDGAMSNPAFEYALLNSNPRLV